MASLASVSTAACDKPGLFLSFLPSALPFLLFLDRPERSFTRSGGCSWRTRPEFERETPSVVHALSTTMLGK